MTREEWTARRQQALQPVVASCGNGFLRPESGPNGPTQWSSGVGEITLTNPLPSPRSVELTLHVTTRAEEPSRLQVKDASGKTTYPMDRAGRIIRRSLVVPLGSTEVKLISNARRVYPAGENRMIVFRVDQITISEAGTGATARPVADAPRAGVSRRRRMARTG